MCSLHKSDSTKLVILLLSRSLFEHVLKRKRRKCAVSVAESEISSKKELAVEQQKQGEAPELPALLFLTRPFTFCS